MPIRLLSTLALAGLTVARFAATPFRLRAFVVLFITACGINPSNSALAAEYEAGAVKAAFLHRFAAYVEWPAESSAGEAFTIAVLDDDQLVSHLQKLLPGLTIHDRRAEVRSVSTPAELDGVQILYIGPRHATRTKTFADAVGNRAILIVTDQTDGLVRGGIINFVQVSRNVRFEVSLTAARRRGLQINAGLLSVALRVEDGPRSGLEDPRPLRLAFDFPARSMDLVSVKAGGRLRANKE
jgi:hypothetical protein